MSGLSCLTLARRVCEYFRKADMGRFHTKITLDIVLLQSPRYISLHTFGASGCFLARRFGTDHGPLYAAALHEGNVRSAAQISTILKSSFLKQIHTFLSHKSNLIIAGFFFPISPSRTGERFPFSSNNFQNIILLQANESRSMTHEFEAWSITSHDLPFGSLAGT